MIYKFVDQNITYDGTQLHSLFGYLEHEVLGDSILSWVGPCNIPPEKIVDGEDLLQGSEIRGAEMLHFIIEKFHASLFAGVGLQRLMATMVKDLLLERQVVTQEQIQRRGDDIYIDDGKLNISIATQSPTSTLIHFAINIKNEGTPVKTSALSDFQVEPREFADKIGLRFSDEVVSMEKATMKVKWVK